MLYNGTSVSKDLFTYLNAWTKSNDSLTTDYLLKYAINPRISVFYQYINTTAYCLTTQGMPWQDLQKWRIDNCSMKELPMFLDYRSPIVTDEAFCETLYVYFIGMHCANYAFYPIFLR